LLERICSSSYWTAAAWILRRPVCRERDTIRSHGRRCNDGMLPLAVQMHILGAALACRGMRALVSSATPPHVELADVTDPEALPNQALVSVRAISLNRGETRRLETLDPGTVTGWDLAGVVARAAADGSGPPEGARVVGLMQSGAWAQLAAVRSDWLAEL